MNVLSRASRNVPVIIFRFLTNTFCLERFLKSLSGVSEFLMRIERTGGRP